MKKRIATLCLLLAVCCGCWAAPGETGETVGASAEREAGSGPIVIAIDAQAAQTIENAAEEFSRWLSADGAETELVKAADPAFMLTSGNAQLAFVDSRDSGGYHPFFSLMAEPFRYRNYLHFTTSLNYEMVLRYLKENMEDSHNKIPLAAYYQGSSLLLSDSALAAVPGSMAEQEDPAEEEKQAYLVLTGVDSLLSAPMELAGASVLETADTLRKLNLVLSQEASLAEFSAWELEEDLLEVNDEETVSVYRAYYDAAPLWLIAEAGFYSRLSSYRQAELQEACAMLFSHIDEVYLAQEQSAYEYLTDFGVAEGGSHLTFRSFIREVASAGAAPLTAEEKHLSELLEQVE